ncbi:MAG: BlaI/MecI/CopY family transcriptional regulator [Desulfatiglans sp.]|jgi:predicted transcriptional regulator|nr:BlaI/MecI/CopY family transcriptional regulator [Desulfatiglans sp.]
MKKNALPKLTPAEFEIMNAVWNSGELTVTEIMNQVNKNNKRNLTRSTIQVQIGRLEEKGWLNHRQEGNKFFFKSTTPRSEASAAIALDIGDRIFGGSCVELVKAFFSRSAVSSEEIRQLRELIDKYEEK